MRRFITMDETWIYHHDPKLKQERLQLKLVLFRTIGKKDYGINFFAKGVLLIDYLEKGKTINSEYYCNLLDSWIKIFVKKDPVY